MNRPTELGPCVHCGTPMGECVVRMGHCCRACSHPLDPSDVLAGQVSRPRIPVPEQLAPEQLERIGRALAQITAQRPGTVRLNPEQLEQIGTAFRQLRAQLDSLAGVMGEASRALTAVADGMRQNAQDELDRQRKDGGK